MKNKSIIRQVQEALESKTAFGESKHLAKQDGTFTKYIYSHKTFDNYLQVDTQFANWARDEHGCKNLDQARQHVSEYLEKRISDGLSAWTVKLDRAGLAKLYDCKSSDFGVQIKERKREDVTRSRQNKSAGKFSEKRNKDLVDFCNATGLRRHEVAKLKPDSVRQEDGKTYVIVQQGKGGKYREVLALNDVPYQIAQKRASEGKSKLFDAIRSHADIHSYRAAYAAALYERLARDISTISNWREVYYCRGDKSGVKYDKAAMQVVSNMLGHERLSVIAQSYLH